MKTITLKIVQKKIKKLEKRYEKTPKECTVTRSNIEKRMQKLMNQADWIRGKSATQLEALNPE